MKYFLCIWVLCMVYLAESASECTRTSERASDISVPLTYQAESLSPARRQGIDGDPTVCIFHREDKYVVCTKGDRIQKCCVTQPVPEGRLRDDQRNGPTPENEYLIGRMYKNPRKKKAPWHNLYPKMENNRGYYGYTSRNRVERSTFALHLGTRSEGCVVVKDKSCWNKLDSIVRAGSMRYPPYRGSYYDGILYVVD